MSPVAITNADAKAHVYVNDLVGIARFAAPAQVVVVDLPPGWTDHHAAVCQTLPDLVLTVTAPTVPAISYHRLRLQAWAKEWTSAVKSHGDADRRRS